MILSANICHPFTFETLGEHPLFGGTNCFHATNWTELQRCYFPRMCQRSFSLMLTRPDIFLTDFFATPAMFFLGGGDWVEGGEIFDNIWETYLLT